MNPDLTLPGSAQPQITSGGMQALTYITIVLVVLPVLFFGVLLLRIVLSMCHRDAAASAITMDAAHAKQRDIKSTGYTQLLEARIMLLAKAKGYSFPTILFLYDEAVAMACCTTAESVYCKLCCSKAGPKAATSSQSLVNSSKRGGSIDVWQEEKPKMFNLQTTLQRLPHDLQHLSNKVIHDLSTRLQPQQASKPKAPESQTP